MLTQLQINFLNEAAQREIDHPGSLQNIFIVAASMGDIDTVQYIMQHYFTTQYFEEELMQVARTYYADTATAH